MEKRLKSIAVSIVIFAVLFGLMAPVQAQEPYVHPTYTVVGFVYDIDGKTPVDGVDVTVTDIDTGDSLSYTTIGGGYYAVVLGPMGTPSPVTEGDEIEIFATYDSGNKTNTTIITAGGEEDSPRFVELILQEGDTTPPYTSGHAPAKDAPSVPVDTNIVVHVMDDGDGVDIATIEMTVEGVEVMPVITGLSDDYTLTYDPPADFNYGQVVDVTIDASDLSSPANPMTQDAYSFTTEQDTILPVIHSVALNPPVVGPGDSILLTVNVTDNDEVDFVAVVGGATPPAYVTLTQSETNPDIWEGSITAKYEIDIHPVTVVADDLSGNRALDTSQSYEVREVVVKEFTIEFVAGYNMISLPVNDTSVKNASLLMDTLGKENCSEILNWNEDTESWDSFSQWTPPVLAFDIVGGKGYFVRMDNPVTVTFSGMGWESPFILSLVKGYNTIGIPVNDTSVTNASLLMDKIGKENCSEILNWNKDTESWDSFSQWTPPVLAFDIVGGDGYFVRMTKSADVTFIGEAWSD